MTSRRSTRPTPVRRMRAAELALLDDRRLLTTAELAELARVP